MAHQRKLIREAVIARLKQAGTAAEDRIFGSRVRSIKEKELPCILVYTKQESAEVSIEAPREFKRDLTVTLELIVQGDTETDVDDALDDLAEQVEYAIFREETFGGVVSDVLLGETEIEILSEGERPVGGAKISLTMPYYQQMPGDQTGALEALETVNIKIDQATADDVIESEDTVEPEQD